jgi:hypothetical protein
LLLLRWLTGFAISILLAAISGSTAPIAPWCQGRHPEAGQLNKEAMDEEDFRSYREAMVRGPLRALLGKDRRLLQAQQ